MLFPAKYEATNISSIPKGTRVREMGVMLQLQRG